MPRYVPAVGVRGFTLTGALRIKQGENENDAIRNRISDFDKRRFLNQKPNKQTSHE